MRAGYDSKRLRGISKERKNLGSRVALLPGKLFPVQKVFQKVHKKY